MYRAHPPAMSSSREGPNGPPPPPAGCGCDASAPAAPGAAGWLGRARSASACRRSDSISISLSARWCRASCWAGVLKSLPARWLAAPSAGSSARATAAGSARDFMPGSISACCHSAMTAETPVCSSFPHASHSAATQPPTMCAASHTAAHTSALGAAAASGAPAAAATCPGGAAAPGRGAVAQIIGGAGLGGGLPTILPTGLLSASQATCTTAGTMSARRSAARWRAACPDTGRASGAHGSLTAGAQARRKRGARSGHACQHGT